MYQYDLSGQLASPVRENSVLSFLQDEDTVLSIIISLYEVKESKPAWLWFWDYASQLIAPELFIVF
jgi:hypothetical protein